MQSTSMSLGKIVQKFGTGDDQEWWSKHQNSLREMKNVQDYFLKPWMNDFKNLGQRPVIILTRHPIDVARMSDFAIPKVRRTLIVLSMSPRDMVWSLTLLKAKIGKKLKIS